MLGQLALLLGDLTPRDRDIVDALARMLSDAGWRCSEVPAETPDAVLVWANRSITPTAHRALKVAQESGTPVVALGPSATADLPDLADAAGMTPASWAPAHSARLRTAGDRAWQQRIAPLGDAIEMQSPVLAIEKTRDAVEVLLTAHLGLTPHPVMTWNPDTSVAAFTVVPDPGRPVDVANTARLVHFLLRKCLALDPPDPVPLTVGLLGFGAIGAEHARAARDLSGMNLAMVCDRSEGRLADAASMLPGVSVTADPEDLLADASVDVVVVSTPPDTHGSWAERFLEAGEHVIIEKPFALTVQESDAVLATARRTGRRAVVYQNRRFDPDFLTIAELVDRGVLGEVFHLEAFVGGYGHPCNYWHSDETVSGGALYDWGSHLIDQILALLPQPIAHVSCVEHKRKWHDVTNADHTSVSLRFQDGTEAVFVHSDLAAALKPRWYLLGTEGAVTSTWRRASVVRRSAIGTLDEDVLAATDSPPDLHLVDHLGSETMLRQQVPERHAFHRQFVDDVAYGSPMTVTAEQSRRVVAVMEAARRSAGQGGALVAVDGA